MGGSKPLITDAELPGCAALAPEPAFAMAKAPVGAGVDIDARRRPGTRGRLRFRRVGVIIEADLERGPEPPDVVIDIHDAVTEAVGGH